MALKERKEELQALRYVLGKPDWVVEADPLYLRLTRLATLGLLRKAYHEVDDVANAQRLGTNQRPYGKCARFDLTLRGYIRIHELILEICPQETVKASWARAQEEVLGWVVDRKDGIQARRDLRAFEILMALHEKGELELIIHEDGTFGRVFEFQVTQAGLVHLYEVPNEPEP